MLLKSVLNNFSKLLISTNSQSVLTRCSLVPFHSKFEIISQQKSSFSTTNAKFGLEEFFDDKKHWIEEKVKHGRPWRMEELRIKSNTDIHKLWYVLSKERNMLLTMEEAYAARSLPMPSHERIAKVDESMENILSVIEERNVAYNLLETGESKARLSYKRYNSFGYIQQYRPREYLVPWYMNKMWKLKYHYKKLPYWSKYYRSLNRVRLRQERNKLRRKVKHHSKLILSKHPEFEENAEHLKEYFDNKFGYKPPQPYSELMYKPKPSDLPRKLKERMEGSSKRKFYDEEF